ncbi:MAG: LCP family protein [Patescibacteria group bacterium]|jgi:LCP family protein required for cell wall assembly
MFLRRKVRKTEDQPVVAQSKKKRLWKIFFIILGIIVVLGISVISYAISSGSKIFENGFGNGADLIKTIYGSKDILKGQKENRINILLFGSGGVGHDGGLLTDSIMILSVRPSDNKAAMISIPRDLWVKMPSGGEAKINSALSIGYNSYLAKNCTKKKLSQCRGEALTSGANYESDVISKLFDIPIHYYVSTDFSGFEKLIDQLGGIDVTVASDIYDPEFPDDKMEGYAPFYIKAGQHHLDGKTALKYARSRHGTSGGDFDRAARQQQILTAVKEKATAGGTLANPKKILDLINTLGDSMKTNMSLPELKEFLSLASKIDRNNMSTKVLNTGKDGYLESSSDGTYHLLPKGGNYIKINSMIKNIFDEPAGTTAKIEIYNASGTPGLATNLSKELARSGEVDVLTVSNAKSVMEKTVIYDYSNGNKKKALDDLSSLLKVGVTAGKTAPANPSSEIAIYIGKDYNSTKN